MFSYAFMIKSVFPRAKNYCDFSLQNLPVIVPEGFFAGKTKVDGETIKRKNANIADA